MARTAQTSELVSRQTDPNILDFSIGQPSPSLLPLEAWKASLSHRLATPDAHLLLQYGPVAGYRSYRVDLATFLSERYGHHVCPDSLLTVAGVSHGLDLACGLLLRPGELILTEAPTYVNAAAVFRTRGLQAVGISMDEDGLDVDALERWLQHAQHTPGGPRVGALYTIPVHHNPSGTVLSHQRRERLVRLAHTYGFWIFADEVYQMLSFPGSAPTPPPLRHFDQALLQQPPGTSADRSGGPTTPADAGGPPAGVGRVVSMGSFSKIMGPGLRLGWLEADAWVLQRLRQDGALMSGGCVAPVAVGGVHSALQLGLLQQHLDTQVLPTLAARCPALCCALQRHLVPLGCAFRRPSGGYFVWLRLPPQVDAATLLVVARAHHGVAFTPGAACGGPSHYARLSFSFYSASELEFGAGQLALALSQQLSAGRAGSPTPGKPPH